MFTVPEERRMITGPMKSDKSYGNNGMFRLPHRENGASVPFTVVASDEQGWEHVSVSLPLRCPTWEEMCKIKSLFWGPEDCVVQYHPPESAYVNNHPYCLHLWRNTTEAMPTPPTYMVGIKNLVI